MKNGGIEDAKQENILTRYVIKIFFRKVLTNG